MSSLLLVDFGRRTFQYCICIRNEKIENCAVLSFTSIPVGHKEQILLPLMRMTYRGFGNSTSRYPKQMRIYRLEVLVETHAARVAIIFGIPADAIFSISNTWIVEDHISEFHWEKQTVKICHSNLIRHLCLHREDSTGCPSKFLMELLSERIYPKTCLDTLHLRQIAFTFNRRISYQKSQALLRPIFLLYLSHPPPAARCRLRKKLHNFFFLFTFAHVPGSSKKENWVLFVVVL